MRKRFPIAVYGAFRMKWKIDGKQLLDLEPTKIKTICNKCPPSVTIDVITSIQELHSQYDVAYKRAIRLNRSRKRKRPVPNSTENKRPFKRRKQMKSKNKSNYYYKQREKEHHDMSNSGEIWDECTLRQAWYFYLPPNNKNFEEIAQLLRRTRIAVLTKINLIRRACHENPDLDTKIKNPLWKCDFSLRMLVSHQERLEKERYQEERMQKIKEEKLEGYSMIDEGKEESDDLDSNDPIDDNDTVPIITASDRAIDDNKENRSGSGSESDDTTASVNHEEDWKEEEKAPEETTTNDKEDDYGHDDIYKEVEDIVHDLLSKRYYGKKDLRKKVAEILDIDDVAMKVYYKILINRAQDSFYSDDEEDY